MTVQELIKELKKYPSDMPVVTRDCVYGWCGCNLDDLDTFEIIAFDKKTGEGYDERPDGDLKGLLLM